MEMTARLVFRGELQPGRSLEEVKASLPALLKITSVEVETLFSIQPVIIGRGLSVSQLAACAGFLQQAGIKADAVEEEAGSTDGPELPEIACPGLAAAVAGQAAITCPQCGARQPAAVFCRECGADMPRYAAARAVLQPAPAVVQARPEIVDTSQEVAAGAALPAMFGFGFQGRLNRLRYMIYGLTTLAAAIASFMLAGFLLLQGRGGGEFVLPVILLFIAVFAGMVFYGLRYAVLRLHDMGLTGWLVLLSFVPMLGGLVWLWLLVWPGDSAGNQYGPPNPPNSLTHQVIAAGLLILLAVLLVVPIVAGFAEWMFLQGGIHHFGPMPWHLEPGSGIERLRRELM